MTNTQSKHTPGPWKVLFDVRNESDDFLCHAIKNNEGMIIAEANKGAMSIAPLDGADLYGEGVANAKLIASAPELLEALRFLASEIKLSKLNVKKDFSLMNAHAGALKAISKAEGEL